MTMRAILPVEVIAVEAEPWMWDAPLHPDEVDGLVHAVPHRRREFAAGRACARSALRQLGLARHPVRRGPDRAPQWPTGIVGSITHCAGYCVAAVAPQALVRALGIDAEEATPLVGVEADLIYTPSELASANNVSLPAALPVAKLIFSAKESFYKCYYPLTGRFLEFSDVAITIVDGSHFVAELTNDMVPGLLGHRRCFGRFMLHRHVILSSVVIR